MTDRAVRKLWGYEFEPDRTIRAAGLDELHEWQGLTKERCRFCAHETPRGHARCGGCNRTLWRRQ